jgi:hypothetical protein
MVEPLRWSGRGRPETFARCGPPQTLFLAIGDTILRIAERFKLSSGVSVTLMNRLRGKDDD